MRYRIVVGVDGSPHSDAALRWALAEAEAGRGEVVAVIAWQVPFMSFPGAFDREELEQDAKQFIIDTVSRIAPKPAIPLWTLVAEATRQHRWPRRRKGPACSCSALAGDRDWPGCGTAR